jgi:NAD:arginine ADP-ribosyltransferase
MTSNDNDLSEPRWRFSDVAEEPRRMLPPIQGYEDKPLVPLEDAVEPLVDDVPNVQQYTLAAKNGCRNPPADGLSIDESASIRLYTMQWRPKEQSLYSVLNKHLRSEDRDDLKKWFLYLKLLITALSKIPSTCRLVYRGVKLDLSHEHPQGRNTIWWGFSSCTTSMRVVEKEAFLGTTGTRTLFKIGCYSGKDIHQHSAFPKEHEVLLLAATEFRIVASFHTSDEVHIIHLKETEPEFPLIVKPNLVIPSSPLSVEQIIREQPTTQLVHRNSDLQRLIASCPPCSTVNLGNQRLTDEDMQIVSDQAINDKACRKLFLQSNLWTSQGLVLLARGLCNSATLEELNLSDNLLSDMDLAPFIQELLKNRVVREKQRSCCGIRKFEVSE